MGKITTVILGCLLATGFVAGEESPWIPKTLVSDTFGKIIGAMPEGGGTASLGAIREMFAPAQSSAAQLAIQIDELNNRLGVPKDFDVVGTKSLQSSRRVFRAAALVYHDQAPSLWNIVFYRPGESWVILELSFTTDEVLDRAIQLLEDRCTPES